MKAKGVLIIVVGLVLLFLMSIQVIVGCGPPCDKVCGLKDEDETFCLLSDFWAKVKVWGDACCKWEGWISGWHCWLKWWRSKVEHGATDKDCWTASYPDDDDTYCYRDKCYAYCRWVVVNVEPKPECPTAPSCSSTARACINAWDCAGKPGG